MKEKGWEGEELRREEKEERRGWEEKGWGRENRGAKKGRWGRGKGGVFEMWGKIGFSQ